MLIDCACNLFAFNDPEIIYQEAINNDISLICAGSDSLDNFQLIDFIENKERLWGCIGIHPHNASEFNEELFIKLKELAKNKKIVAIGECGLDYNRLFSSKQTQINCFKKHIELALELNKPLYLHCREAFGDLLSILKDYPGLCQKSLIHCFTGNKKEAQQCLDLGFSLGITGWIADERRNTDLLDALKTIPKERLVIETDAPYLLPRNHHLKGKNKPVYLTYVLEDLSKELNIDKEELKETVNKNTLSLFNIEKGL